MSLIDSPYSYKQAVRLSSNSNVKPMLAPLCMTKNCDEYAIIAKRRDNGTYKHSCAKHGLKKNGRKGL